VSTIYKVSFMVQEGNHPGAILNMDHRPHVGERVKLGEQEFTVLEVIDLLPPRGDFCYLHVTIHRAEE
jgi:hypothetical protein